MVLKTTTIVCQRSLMHKKRTYRRRAKEQSDSDEEISNTITDATSVPKPLGLSFEDSLESDSPFIPRAPQPRSEANAKVLNDSKAIHDQEKSEAPILEGTDPRLTVRHLEDKGVSVFAAARIPAGQTLIREQPYGAVIDDANLTKYCTACFKPSEQPLSRCSSCKFLHYCSRQCQISDWKQYHSIECPSYTKIGKRIPAAVRCITRMLIRRANDPISFKTVERLTVGKDAVPEKIKMKYAQLIMAVRQILPAKMMPSASDTMELICRFTVNSMSVLGFDYAGVGVGLFTNVCRLNHSCWPNCAITFEGKTAVLRTIGHVEESEELCISYIDVMEPYETRQERLSEQYYFKCQCTLCVLTKNMDIRSALRCLRKDCTGAIRYPGNYFDIFLLAVHDTFSHFLNTSLLRPCFTSLDNLESGELYTSLCSVCSTELVVPLADIQERQDRVENLLKLGSSMTSTDKPRARLNLENAVRIGDGILHNCHHLLVKARQHLKDIAIDMNDWETAYNVTQQLYEAYQHIYPSNSPITAIESYVIAKMYSNLHPEYSWTLHAHYAQALRLLEVCYETNSNVLQSVRREIRELEAERSFAQMQRQGHDVQ
ncbi:hypothetical protein BC943DRAFT_324588 [Umbelopsis sp. AD052]|nr:hypothetical protein BC943DRAFT_324588 [Umbelopsis sp. AD052]